MTRAHVGRTGGGSMLGDVNISAILDSFSVSYDKRVRPNYGVYKYPCVIKGRDLEFKGEAISLLHYSANTPMTRFGQET
ncbi:hypothetical protein J6590_016993 [Homalodisca vitripennis]|nr:hypothetical protein J6590_016993 [Homalodisca vitripennis]